MKTGRKQKIDFAAERQIYAILTVGGSLNDAADFLSIDRKTITNHKQRNKRFSQGIDRATSKGKLYLLKKMRKAGAWQAAAWMLERKWGSEYGSKNNTTHDGTVKVIVEYTDECKNSD